MAFEKSWHAKTYRAASVILPGQPVVQLGALTPASALNETVVPVIASGVAFLGVARASAAIGAAVDVDLAGFVKCVAGASLGQGAWIGVGTTNGQVQPMIPLAAAAASTVRFTLGQAEQSAAPGDIFTVRLTPGELF